MSEVNSQDRHSGRMDRQFERDEVTENNTLHSNTEVQTSKVANNSVPVRSLPSNLTEETIRSTKIFSKRNVLPLFVVNIAFVVMFYMFINVYNNAVIRTLERRFGLTSAQTGLLQSSNDIIHVLIVIFIGYYGRTANKPRIICSTVMFYALAGFMMASPHFLLAPSSHDQQQQQQQTQATIASNGSEFDSFASSNILCVEPVENNLDGDRCDDINSTASHRNSLLPGTHPAYSVFLAAQIVSGFAGAGLHTLSFAYIDENASQSKSSFYIGIISSVYAFGPLGGMMIAALSLRLPENLLSPVTTDPSDPSWIGCWWLGYLICATGLSLSCIPLWFFPKSCKNGPMENNFEAKKLQCSSRENVIETSAKQEIIEFPRRLLSLLRNRPFVVSMLSVVCGAYIVTGVYANLVRYIEIHFLERAFVGSLIAGLVSALAGAAGGFLGGLLVSRLKLRPVGSMKIVLLSDACFASGLVIVMLLGCPQLQMAGRVDPTENKFTVITECSQHCGCNEAEAAYAPVCGSDNLTYFSACMAGCKNLSNGMYSGCSCIGSSTSTLDSAVGNGAGGVDGFASPGLCHPSCNLIVPFAVTLFLISLVGAMARVPSTIVNFRVVDDDERSFAMGLNSFALNLLGFVPAPLLFGALIDWTCKLWQTTTCKKTGSCLLYDTDRFRYVTYGVAMLFKGIGLALSVILFLLVRKMVFRTTEEKAIELEVNSCEKEQDKGPLQGA